MILYRGVSHEFHEKHEGRLIPKEVGPFMKPALYGKGEYGNAFYGINEENAVVEHQLHQAGYATSGISTIPSFERATFYATCGGKLSSGLIYEIDSKSLDGHGVCAYIVSAIVPSPSVPEDREVVLVAKNFGELPQEIITKVHEIRT